MRPSRSWPLSLAALTCMALAGAPVRALAEEPPPVRILFIGNSFTFTNDLPQLLRKLAAASGIAVSVHVHASGGATLEQHASNDTVRELLRQRWDRVVLQEQSQLPSLEAQRKKSTSPAIAALRDAAARGGSTHLVLFTTWGYRDGDRLTLPGDTFAAMQARLDAGFTALAAEHHLPLVPVAAAWADARRAHPEWELWSPDGKHPALAGSYLAACVFYRALLQRSPVGNAFTAGLPEDRARGLQELAERAAR